ncbi:unnamed protein product [Moneuplotes crassus]|uniref:Uncharacterized protein n=1 Tax=Euplotes crassus TaxID=5936 RepID=A0AAD1UGI1_EUPCR|nr:unnamed protein product [Moneuplotes crassus]
MKNCSNRVDGTFRREKIGRLVGQVFFWDNNLMAKKMRGAIECVRS